MILIRDEDIDKLTHQELKNCYKSLANKFLGIEFELEQLKRAVFGRKSERFIPSQVPEQMELGLDVEEKEELQKPEKEKITYERKRPQNGQKKNKPSRNEFPEHLERRAIIIEPEGDLTGYQKIGSEVTEYLDFDPATLFVQQIVRIKYKRQPAEEQAEKELESKIEIAPLPPRPIPRSIAGSGLIAHVLVSKFVDHVPLYRLIQIFKREKVPLAQSTLSDWVKRIAILLQNLYSCLEVKILATDYLEVDETSIPVMSRGHPGGVVKGCMLVQYAPLASLVLFSYTKTKHKVRLSEHLKTFRGHLQADGNISYVGIAKKKGVTLSNCLTHARRKFEKALKSDYTRASHVLKQIQRIYCIERALKKFNLTSDEIRTFRQVDTGLIMNELKHWFKKQAPELLPKSPMAQAIAYTTKRWKGLTQFLNEPFLLPDNNLVENAIRPLALGRKNYLFAGSHDSAHYHAIFYSFFATCKANGIEPYGWLKDVLNRIHDHPIERLDELLPTSAYTPLRQIEN